MAVKQYAKHQVGGLGATGEFKISDFDCHCNRPDCVVTLVDEDLVTALEQLVDTLGLPKVNSGYRCAAHNREVGGKPDSQHLLGKAADVASQFNTPAEIAAAAERIGTFANGGLGLYSNFVHLDSRWHRARWSGPENC